MSTTEKLVLNIDSRFRNNPEISTSSDFTIDLPTPVRNVKAVRLVSEEIPNVFYAFDTDSTTVFQVRKGPNPDDTDNIYTHQEWTTLYLSPGNYDANSFITTITPLIGKALGFLQSDANTPENRGFGYTIDSNTGMSTLKLNLTGIEYRTSLSNETAPYSFELNLTPVDLNTVYTNADNAGAFDTVSGADKYITEIDIYAQAIQYYIRNLDIGVITLKEVMGFSDFLLYSKTSYTSTSLINTRGFNYVLLDINGYDTLTHVSKDNEYKCFAKIPFKVSKFFTSISSVGATTFPKIFDQPETIRKFTVRILDIFGNIVNLRSINVNLMFEVEYYRTQESYDKARNAIVPSGNMTKFSSDGFKTTQQSQRADRLRNIVFTS